jgi:putative ABC transport system ATP-binding protein
MEQSIFRYTWKHTRRDQIWLLLVVLISQPFYFLSLDLPKRIINGPIRGEGFASPGETQLAGRVALSVPEWLGGSGSEFVLFGGIPLERVPTLYWLCGLFLAFVLINGVFKLYISTYKGRLGERMLRRLRFELLDRLLRFPMSHFRRVRSSEVATMIKDEVEPLGGFIGDAFVQPAFLVSQAVTAMIFILLQSWSLGLVAAAIVAVQVVLIPRLRRRLLVLGRLRQITARQLAGRVGEVVEGITAIRVNDTSNWERSEIAGRLGRIFFIRFDIYQWKFLVKFINNLLAQVTPFVFYLVGGFLAISGRLDIGQLVAVIAAYKDLPSPLKDLIDWDQQRLDVQVKFTQVVEQFAVDPLVDPALQSPRTESPPHIQREIAVTNLSVRDDSGATLLEGTNFRLRPGEHVAAIGSVGAGGEYAAEALARLATPATGRVTFDGEPIENLPEAMTGRRVGYVEAHTYFPQATLGDSLLYGLRHHPLRQIEREARTETTRRHEAIRSGNIEFSIEDDWIDYEAAGAKDPEDLIRVVHEVLAIVDLEDDVYRLGLRSRLPEPTPEDVAARILEAREAFRHALAAEGADDMVEIFDPGHYLVNASLMENLVFGFADADALGGVPLERHSYFAACLRETGLDAKLYAMGVQIADTLVDLFGDLAPDNPLLERLDLMGADEIEFYRAVLRRVAAVPFDAAEPADRQAVMRLALGYIEPRHRLGLLDDTLKEAVLEARRVFRAELPDTLADSVRFHETGALNPMASVLDNVLFGRIVETYADARARISALLRNMMDELGLTDIVINLGLGFDHGSGAKRLSGTQQQKLALARAVIKRPDLLIVNRALSTLDAAVQEKIAARLFEHLARPDMPRTTVFWVLNHPSLASLFDRVLEFENGRLASGGNTAGDPAPASDPVEPKRAAQG